LKILINSVHYPVCSARYMVDAYRRLGHDVRHEGPETGGAIWGLHLPDGHAWHAEPPEDGWQPDLIIVMDTHPDILDGAQRYEGIAPLVCHTVDNHVRDVRRPWFSRYFVGHLHPSIMPWLPNMTHVPCGYDPALFTPSPIPFAEREYDVAILGVMYDDRRKAAAELTAEGFKVIAGCGLVGESYRDAHHHARIALCLPARNDVAQRIFECAAMGNMVMTPWLPDFQKLRPRGLYLLRQGTPLGDQVEDAMAHADHIPEAQEWAANYTWDKLAAQVLEGK
jgi:hypothetical protein